jgi:hypothetical protein
MGVENGNIFVEVNTDQTNNVDAVETYTTPFTYTEGWNMIGCYYDTRPFASPAIPGGPWGPAIPATPTPDST